MNAPARAFTSPRASRLLLGIACSGILTVLVTAAALESDVTAAWSAPAQQDDGEEGGSGGTDNGDSGDTGTEDGGSSDSSNASLIVVAMLGGAIGIILFSMLFRGGRSKRPHGRPGTASGWRARTNEVCADGREIVELTTMTEPDEPGSGLTIDQLRIIEGRVDLLIGQLQDVEITAPSQLAGRSIGVAASYARALNDVVQTERQIRLASISPDVAILDTTTRQLMEERTALDLSLRDISTMIAGRD